MAQTFKLARLPVRRTVSRSVPTSRNTIVTRFRFHGSRSSFTPEMCKECARPVQDHGHGAQLEYQPPCGARAARSVYTIRPIPRRATSTETPTGTTNYSFQPARVTGRFLLCIAYVLEASSSTASLPLHSGCFNLSVPLLYPSTRSSG